MIKKIFSFNFVLDSSSGKVQNTPDKGEIKIDGENLYRSRALVALMPQRSSMNWKFPITVEKLVSLGPVSYTHLTLPTNREV